VAITPRSIDNGPEPELPFGMVPSARSGPLPERDIEQVPSQSWHGHNAQRVADLGQR